MERRNRSLILEKKETPLERGVLEGLKPKGRSRARAASKRIRVYRITHRSQGHRVTGFIAEPRAGANLPCIIWNRGGNRDFGQIRTGNIFSGSMGSFAEAGYIVIASQYSGNDGGEGADYHGGSDLADVLVLQKILKTYPRADATRIGMFGASRGGLMCYLALTRVGWIKAMVIQAGVANLFHQVNNRPELRKLYRELFGGSRAEYVARSPMLWVEKFRRKTPVLLMHGSADWRVPVADTLEMGRLFSEYTIPYRMIIYEGDDHALTRNKRASIRESIAWFDRFVKNREPLPNLEPHGA